MRLRYLKLDQYPPLARLSISFATDAPWIALLDDKPSKCAFHFVAGLNGSGKSHLLRALASTFLALADKRMPAFPLTLIYELGAPERGNAITVLIDRPQQRENSSIWQIEGRYFADNTNESEFDETLRQLRGGELTTHKPPFVNRINAGIFSQSITDLLPNVLAYTSGALGPWHEAWSPPINVNYQDTTTAELDLEDERPAGWTEVDETSAFGVHHIARPLSTEPLLRPEDVQMLRRPLLLDGIKPDAALLAVALHAKLHNRAGKDSGLSGLFSKTGWQNLASIRLKLNLTRATSINRALLPKLHDLLIAAGETIVQPHPADSLRVLHFDIDGPLPQDRKTQLLTDQVKTAKDQGEALALLLGEPTESAFNRFVELMRWLSLGLIDGIEMSLHRSDDGQEDKTVSKNSGVMSYDQLSDGEQMVLRRWGLFHVLAGQDDALLLLDEPETHFNDVWKREIVHIIEQAMGLDNSSVLIASHSSIVLSDVFDEEIIHIIKADDGTSSAQSVNSRTFATDPSALMISVFGADESIGLRAKRRLDAFLKKMDATVQLKPRELEQLKSVIAHLGTGFYRSELTTQLRRFERSDELKALDKLLPGMNAGPLKNSLIELIDKHGKGDKSA